MAAAAIRIAGLVKTFGNHQAVDGLDLEVPQGSIFGFLGRNGAGKTTTIKILMNMLKPTAGTVEVLGQDPHIHEKELKERVGYISDNPVLYDWMKVEEVAWFAGQLYPRWDQQKVAALIEHFGLDPKQKVKHLSRGMNAQLNLALVLGHDPELLILDEPASGLDVIVRRDVLESIIQVISAEGRTVFFSSHLVHEVERVADQVAIIEQGKLLVCGELDAVRQQVKRVLVRTEGAVDFAGVPGLRGVQGEGRQRLLTIFDYGGEAKAQIEAAGGQIVEVIDLSLEESFVEHVTPQGELPS